MLLIKKKEIKQYNVKNPMNKEKKRKNKKQ